MTRKELLLEQFQIEIAGYRGELSQPAVELCFNLPALDELNLQLLDRGFAKYLQLSLPEEQVKPLSGLGLTRVLLQRVLLLSQSLLNDIKIPVFEQGKILSLTPASEGVYSATVLVPVIDYLAPDAFVRAFQTAMAIIQFLAENTDQDELVERYLQKVQKQFIDPVASIVTSGRSTLPLLQIAHEKGIPFRHLGAGVYQLGWGRNSTLLDRSSRIEDSAAGARLTQNRLTVNRVLRNGGLPVIKALVAEHLQALEAVADKVGFPCVVKPFSRGRVVEKTSQIDDDESLLQNFQRVSQGQGQVWVESLPEGNSHRFFVSGGRLIYAVERRSFSVKGDGKSSVIELIEQESNTLRQQPPWRRSKLFSDDQLSQQGISMDSVPELGREICLRSDGDPQMEAMGEKLCNDIHPANRQLVIRAASLCGLNSAGVDMVSQDISVPWYENDAVVADVHYAPKLDHDVDLDEQYQLFIDSLNLQKGIIPVEFYLGDSDALEAAKERQQQLSQEGIGCYIATDESNYLPDGARSYTPHSSAFMNVHALLMDKAVVYLIVVVSNDEFLVTGLPVNRVKKVVEVNRQLVKWPDNGELKKGAVNKLLKLFSEVG